MKAPKAPDPYATAQAQAAANIQASSAQAAMNMVDQVNPYGTLNYTQRGTTNVGGQVVPQYTATTVLSPEQQHLLDQTTQATPRPTTSVWPRSTRSVRSWGRRST